MPPNPTRPSTNSNNAKGKATYANKDDSKPISGSKFSAESGTTFNTDYSEASQRNRKTAMGKPTTNAVAGSEDQLPATQSGGANNNTAAGGVNRKKQKRRQKQAARLAAEEGLSVSGLPDDGFGGNGHAPIDHLNHHTSSGSMAPQQHPGHVDEDFGGQEHYDAVDGDDLYYSDEEGQLYHGPYDPGNSPTNGHAETAYLPTGALSNKKSKKKRKAKTQVAPHQDLQQDTTSISDPSASHAPPPPPPPPPLSTSTTKPAPSMARDRIWNTSTQEERERIKEFWLSLNEDDRRSLVKVEKEAVLRKMKEQQKHSCSCTVCGRKRTAIEEELEVLYDAYYEELEQYANHQQSGLEDGAPMMPPPRRFGPTRNMHPSERLPPGMGPGRSSKGRIRELPDEDDGEEDFSDEDDEDVEYSDESIDAASRGPAAEFFNFGNSLTVQGGILTVADDLLKNDGKKFIEMMEQLAERRMQREEEAQYAAAGFAHASMNLPGQHSHAGHNHPPLAEDEEYDEDDDEEYDSQEDEEYDEEEMDAMTEEQRMEEGRRMFQIFAARMFEQRVLTAYKEKVAQERQKKLLEELEEESRLDVQREQKKAKEAQKKKDKKRLQKLARDEERARKEAEKAAEEAAARALEEQKAEELRQKREEQRKKKEAEKRAHEEERLRGEAEKQRKLQEERERQAELERKHREQKEREKKRKEEARRKEREEREAKERAAKERKEREEKERREKEAKARAERAERETQERARKQELATQLQAAAPFQPLAHPTQVTNPSSKRLAQPPSLPTPGAPPGLQPPNNNSKPLQSPHLQIATPAIPKAPGAARPHQTASQQGSVSSSPKTPQVLTGKVQSASPSNASQRSSPGPIGPPRRTLSQQPIMPNPQPVTTLPATVASPPAVPLASQHGFPGRPTALSDNMPMNPPSNFPGSAHRGPVSNDTPLYTHQPPLIGSQFRGFQTSNLLPGQPVLNTTRPVPQGRAPFMEGPPSLQHQTPQPPIGAAPPGQVYGISRDSMPTHSHSRQQSLDTPSLDNLSILPPTQPISRPAPIQRPASVAPQRADENHRHTQSDVDDLSNHLGSSALLDDNDEPFPSDTSLGRRGSMAPMPPAPGQTRSRFSFASMYQQGIQGKGDGLGIGGPAVGAHTWTVPQVPFGGSNLPRISTWTPNPGAGWSNANAFGIIGSPNRPTLSRPVNVRLLIVQACKQLSATKKNGDDFHEVGALLRQIEQIRPVNEPPVQMRELLEICETEGDAHNGGGYFSIKNEGQGPGKTTLVKYEAGGNVPRSARGSIGSPVSSSVYC